MYTVTGKKYYDYSIDSGIKRTVTGCDLVLVTRSLAVLSQSDETLVDEGGIVGMDVETQQHEASSTDSTDGVQEVESLSYEIVGSLAVALMPQIVLEENEEKCMN